ncbi:MAG: TPM domain-containing protein [Pseudomonadota bacterium]
MALRLFLLPLALLATACIAEAQTAENTEPSLELTGRVVDAGQILTPEFEERLTTKLAQLEADTQVQFVVATTPSLLGQDIETYSLNLANGWGIGSKERNDGLLLLVAANERRVRIEVGYGLEASVKDEEAAEIIATQMLPRFRESDYEGGIEAGVRALIYEVTPSELKEAA